MKKNNNDIDLIERARILHNDLRFNLLTDIVTLHINEYHLRIPSFKRYEAGEDLTGIEEDSILNYGDYYLTISTERTQIIDTQMIRKICNKHGFDWGTMMMIKDSPRFHQQLRNQLLIVLVDLNNKNDSH